MALSDFESLAGNYKVVLLDGSERHINNALISSCKGGSLVTFLDAKEVKTVFVISASALKYVEKVSETN